MVSRRDSGRAGIHLKLNQQSSGGLASAMYQDGLLHGLEDVLTSTALGSKKTESFGKDLVEAEGMEGKAREQDNVIEIAYWSGRREAVDALCSRRNTRIPAYFHPYRLCPLPRFVIGDRLSNRMPKLQHRPIPRKRGA